MAIAFPTLSVRAADKESFLREIASQLHASLPNDIAGQISISIQSVPAKDLYSTIHQQGDDRLRRLAEREFLQEYREKRDEERTSAIITIGSHAAGGSIAYGTGLPLLYRSRVRSTGRFVDQLSLQPNEKLSGVLGEEIWQRLARQVRLFNTVRTNWDLKAGKVVSRRLPTGRILLDATTSFPIVLDPEIRDAIIERSVTGYLREVLKSAFWTKDTNDLPKELGAMEFHKVPGVGEETKALPPTIVRLGEVEAELRSTIVRGTHSIGASVDEGSINDTVAKFLRRSPEVHAYRANLIATLKSSLPQVPKEGAIQLGQHGMWGDIPGEIRTELRSQFLKAATTERGSNPLSLLGDFSSFEEAGRWFETLKNFDPRVKTIHRTFVEGVRRGQFSTLNENYYLNSSDAKFGMGLRAGIGIVSGAAAGALLGVALHFLLDDETTLSSVVPVEFDPFDDEGLKLSPEYLKYVEARAREQDASCTYGTCRLRLIVLDEVIQEAIQNRTGQSGSHSGGLPF